MCVCVCIKGIPPPPPFPYSDGIAQLAERQTAGKARCNTVAGTTPRYGGKEFSPKVNFLYRLSLLHGLRRGVQSHVSTSVLTLEIPETGSRTIVRKHKNTAHTPVGMGSAALAAALPYPDKSTRISRMGQ